MVSFREACLEPLPAVTWMKVSMEVNCWSTFRPEEFTTAIEWGDRIVVSRRFRIFGEESACFTSLLTVSISSGAVSDCNSSSQTLQTFVNDEVVSQVDSL